MSEGYQERARGLVYEYIKTRLEKTDKHVTFGPDEVYVVWFCKTLQHWKALVSTTLPDGMYYEVTHNGADNKHGGVTYLDAYKKFDNVAIPDSPLVLQEPLPLKNERGEKIGIVDKIERDEEGLKITATVNNPAGLNLDPVSHFSLAEPVNHPKNIPTSYQ